MPFEKPPAPRRYHWSVLEVARMLQSDGVHILNPDNLNPQTIDDINMEWVAELRAYSHHISGELAQRRRAKRKAEAEARKNQ